MSPTVPRWTSDEITLLRMNYPVLGPEAVAEMLPGRTVCSVKRMANRLCLTGPNHKQWSAEEKAPPVSLGVGVFRLFGGVSGGHF